MTGNIEILKWAQYTFFCVFVYEASATSVVDQIPSQSAHQVSVVASDAYLRAHERAAMVNQ